MQSELLGLHPLVSVATPDSITPPVPRLQHSRPALAGMQGSAFCFIRGVVITQTSLFARKIYAAQSDAYRELFSDDKILLNSALITLFGRNLCGLPSEGSLAIFPSLSPFTPTPLPSFQFLLCIN